MPTFRLYNTMTRQIEPFAPADGRTVRMYTCGPTVYKPAHLGNFRTFLFEDLLRRALALAGWGVEQVMNLTDVDDKIIAKAHAQGAAIGAITEPETARFFADRDYLRIQPAEHYPRATQYVGSMIRLVERLLTRGLAYRAEDRSVYFAIRRFPNYGRLSRLDVRGVKAGARVAQDDYAKEDAQDFALWKAAKPEDEAAGAAWDSPWGRGRPGWHLECSAMAMELLGETLDLHCGGVDLIFPHHEDEIAQSEGATGRTFARAWCHGEFLLMEGTKMAKRVGNIVTVGELREGGVSAAAVRRFVFNTHYRQVLNLTDDAMAAATANVSRLGELAERLDLTPEGVGGTPALSAAAEQMEQRVREALADDLDSPGALAAVADFMHVANAELDRGGRDRQSLERARGALDLIRRTLDIVPARRPGGVVSFSEPAEGLMPTLTWSGGSLESDGSDADAELERWVNEQLQARAAARARRDFASADAIRDALAAKGIAIADSGSGTRWKKLR
jgi:cysteinyl-tRNA synthetase